LPRCDRGRSRGDHLFEEPGALDQVVALSRRWFIDHLPIEEKA
jgi:hypothetical protein